MFETYPHSLSRDICQSRCSHGLEPFCITNWSSSRIYEGTVITGIYTHRQKLSNNTFFGDTVLEVAERNMWVMEIKYFEFYCKFYYFYEHFE